MRSKYPDVKVPNVDLWDFLFENPSRPYRDDKGEQKEKAATRGKCDLLIGHSSIPRYRVCGSILYILIA